MKLLLVVYFTIAAHATALVPAFAPHGDVSASFLRGATPMAQIPSRTVAAIADFAAVGIQTTAAPTTAAPTTAAPTTAAPSTAAPTTAALCTTYAINKVFSGNVGSYYTPSVAVTGCSPQCICGAIAGCTSPIEVCAKTCLEDTTGKCKGILWGNIAGTVTEAGTSAGEKANECMFSSDLKKNYNTTANSTLAGANANWGVYSVAYACTTTTTTATGITTVPPALFTLNFREGQMSQTLQRLSGILTAMKTNLDTAKTSIVDYDISLGTLRTSIADTRAAVVERAAELKVLHGSLSKEAYEVRARPQLARLFAINVTRNLMKATFGDGAEKGSLTDRMKALNRTLLENRSDLVGVETKATALANGLAENVTEYLDRRLKIEVREKLANDGKKAADEVTKVMASLKATQQWREARKKKFTSTAVTLVNSGVDQAEEDYENEDDA